MAACRCLRRRGGRHRIKGAPGDWFGALGRVSVSGRGHGLQNVPDTWVTLSAFSRREVWMPWRESTVMEERLRFVARRLEGERMTALCREFGISRKTGHKLFNRYKDHGVEALADRPGAGRVANRLPMPVEAVIVALRRERPSWGARKLRELLARRLGPGVPVPARSTIHAVARPARPGRARARPAGARQHRHGPVAARRPERALGRRLQGRVPPRQRQALLPAHRHRPGLTLPAHGRGIGGDGGSACVHGLSAAVRGARAARRNPFRHPYNPFARPAAC